MVSLSISPWNRRTQRPSFRSIAGVINMFSGSRQSVRSLRGSANPVPDSSPDETGKQKVAPSQYLRRTAHRNPCSSPRWSGRQARRKTNARNKRNRRWRCLRETASHFFYRADSNPCAGPLGFHWRENQPPCRKKDRDLFACRTLRSRKKAIGSPDRLRGTVFGYVG